ncbi:hypothetical protein Bbelb_224420 [Branchiostoma belcheri]|nr:hypothetical protein Bbelb_224420 [Branchiostoma belcheri]
MRSGQSVTATPLTPLLPSVVKGLGRVFMSLRTHQWLISTIRSQHNLSSGNWAMLSTPYTLYFRHRPRQAARQDPNVLMLIISTFQPYLPPNLTSVQASGRCYLSPQDRELYYQHITSLQASGREHDRELYYQHITSLQASGREHDRELYYQHITSLQASERSTCNVGSQAGS